MDLKADLGIGCAAGKRICSISTFSDDHIRTVLMCFTDLRKLFFGKWKNRIDDRSETDRIEYKFLFVR